MFEHVPKLIRRCPLANRNFSALRSRRKIVRPPPRFPAYSRTMKSMTGCGRGESVQDGFKITVELGAVNRRQSEISVNLPRELEMLEAQIRDAINSRVARGRVTALRPRSRRG